MIFPRAVALLAALFALPAQAVELKVFSGNGSRAAVVELTQRFEKETGNKVTVDFAVNPTVQKRVEDGEQFDLAVLNPPTLDTLIKEGKIKGDTRRVIGRIGIGMAIAADKPKPDISTVDAFKKALLDAKAVAFPGDGASGKYFNSLVDRLGMREQLKDKLRPMPGEYNVEVVAKGDIDVVVVVASRIYGVPGAQLVGLIPAELQTWIGFATAVSANARQPEAAAALTRYLTAPGAEPFLRQMGMEPFVE